MTKYANSELPFSERFNELELKLIELLNVNKVEYLLIGSVAAAFYGARKVEDTTNDLDFLYLPSAENSRRLLNVIETAYANVGLQNTIADHSVFAKPKLQFHLERYYCEFLSTFSETEFNEMKRRSIKHELSGTVIEIAAIDDLILMKKAAISKNTGADEKHYRDLQMLLALSAI